MIVATTDRLRLRVLDERDVDDILRLNSDPEVLKHVHDVPFADRTAALAWIRDISRELPRGINRWAIEAHDGTWIGRCSLRRQANDDVLMGYRLLREQWGRGYATEAARAMLSLAFGVHGLLVVKAKTAAANVGSRRVLEKLGGRHEMDDGARHASEVLVYRFEA